MLGLHLATCQRELKDAVRFWTLSEFIVGGGTDDKRASKLECLKSLIHLLGISYDKKCWEM